MHLMSYVTLKCKIMDRQIIRNIAILVVLLLPGVLVFADSLFLNFLGVFYLWRYWENIGAKIYARYKEVCGEDE